MHVVPKDTLQAFRHQWETWRSEAAGPMPRKDQVNPKAIKQILPYVSLIDIDPDGKVVGRLSGTFYRDLFGEELGGKAVELIRKYQGTSLFLPPAAFRAVVDQPCGMLSVRRFPAVTGDTWIARIMTLPLSDGQGRPTMAMYTLEMEKEGDGAEVMLDLATLQIQQGVLQSYGFFDLGFGVPLAEGPLAGASVLA